MASRPKNSRLSPPLMSVFRQAHKDRDAKKQLDNRTEFGVRLVAARRSIKAAISEGQLRVQLSQDLDTLINTINFQSIQDISALKYVSQSILNFGIPDIVNRTIDENRVDDIVDEIRTAICTYEPRLIASSIVVRRDALIDPSDLNVRFFVNGEMKFNPIAVPVEFIADLEVASGKLTVSKR